MAIFVSTITKTLMELARISEGGTYARMLVYHYLKGRKDKISSETATNVKRTVSKAMQADLNLKEFEFEAEVLKLLPRQMQRERLHAVRKPILVHHPSLILSMCYAQRF